MGRPVLGCIADDFTGATDLANNLVRAGMRCVQTIGVPSDTTLAAQSDAADRAEGEVDAIVVALKTRTIAAADAAAQALAALRWLQAQGCEQCYFKICSTFDSTDAGNIGPVIDALLDALHGPGQGFTIACPAFPENKRTVFKGHLFVGDALLNESGMQHHPLTPMTDANLVRVLQRQTRRPVGLVPYDVVALGPLAIRARLDVMRAEGLGVAIVDAISDSDLTRIGQALAGMPLIVAGSGIALGLPQNWRTQGRLPTGVRTDALPPAHGLRAIVSGSCSLATQTQVGHFIEAGGAAFAIDPLAVARGDAVVAQAMRHAQTHLARGPVLYYATAAHDAVRAVQAQLGVEAAGALVEETLAAIARGVVERGVRQLVVAGGETSGAVVQALGVVQMRIGPQIDPGVPWTATRSPLTGSAPLHLALKSGNFGGPDFFTRAFAVLARPPARTQ